MAGATAVCRTEKIHLSTSTTLITTNDPVRLAEDYAYLQHLAGGRISLMMGRGNTGPVYPWFGQDIHNNIFWPTSHTARMVNLYRQRYEYYGHGKAEHAI